MEKPILFNTEMVQAILQGRKTSTRRIIKEYIPEDAECGYTFFTPKRNVSFRGTFEGQYGEKFYKPPYWIGDILYVRETWRKQPVGEDGHIEIQYKADFSKEELACYGRRGGYAPCKWHPSIHMSKSIARLYLKVTDIKAQRLQDITERETLREGIRRYHFNMNMPDAYGDNLYTKPELAFKALWDSCGYKECNSWDANPWVWVIEFQKFNKE